MQSLEQDVDWVSVLEGIGFSVNFSLHKNGLINWIVFELGEIDSIVVTPSSLPESRFVFWTLRLLFLYFVHEFRRQIARLEYGEYSLSEIDVVQLNLHQRKLSSLHLLLVFGTQIEWQSRRHYRSPLLQRLYQRTQLLQRIFIDRLKFWLNTVTSFQPLKLQDVQIVKFNLIIFFLLSQ